MLGTQPAVVEGDRTCRPLLRDHERRLRCGENRLMKNVVQPRSLAVTQKTDSPRDRSPTAFSRRCPPHNPTASASASRCLPESRASLTSARSQRAGQVQWGSLTLSGWVAFSRSPQRSSLTVAVPPMARGKTVCRNLSRKHQAHQSQQDPHERSTSSASSPAPPNPSRAALLPLALDRARSAH